VSLPIHPRTVITDALVAKLRNPAVQGGELPTDVGENVEHNWPPPVMPDDLPKIILWDDQEPIEGEIRQDVPRRMLEVHVAIMTKGNTKKAINQYLDSVSLQVERAILADKKLKDDNGWAWAKDIKLVLGAAKAIGKDKSRRRIGTLGMIFEVEYGFVEDVTGQLDKFLTFHGEIILDPYLHPDADRVDAEAEVEYKDW
jgi:hypothetical protein